MSKFTCSETIEDRAKIGTIHSVSPLDQQASKNLSVGYPVRHGLIQVYWKSIDVKGRENGGKLYSRVLVILVSLIL